MQSPRSESVGEKKTRRKRHWRGQGKKKGKTKIKVGASGPLERSKRGGCVFRFGKAKKKLPNEKTFYSGGKGVGQALAQGRLARFGSRKRAALGKYKDKKRPMVIEVEGNSKKTRLL